MAVWTKVSRCSGLWAVFTPTWTDAVLKERNLIRQLSFINNLTSWVVDCSFLIYYIVGGLSRRIKWRSENCF